MARLFRRDRACSRRRAADGERYRHAIFSEADRRAVGLRNQRSPRLQCHSSGSIFPERRREAERAREFAPRITRIARRRICHRDFTITDGRIVDADALQRGRRAGAGTSRRLHRLLARAGSRVFREYRPTVVAGPRLQQERYRRRAARLHHQPQHRETVLA